MQPTGFGRGVIGHATVIRLLASWLEHPAHGYVFHGPRHVGKHLVAEQFVNALLECGMLNVEGGRINRAHPDLIVLEPVEGKNVISVEQVREARATIATRPMVAVRRVLYVPGAHQLNEEGMNALLKVLEEPPAGAVFVFVTDHIARLPATVQSRMVKVPLTTVSKQEIVTALIERGVQPEEAEKRASASRGRPGFALEPREIDESASRFLSATSLGERLFIIEDLTKRCESDEQPAEAWRSVLDDFATELRATNYEPSSVLVLGEAVATAQRFVGGALSPRLPLEAAALRLSSATPLANLFPSHLPQPFPRIFQPSL